MVNFPLIYIFYEPNIVDQILDFKIKKNFNILDDNRKNMV